MKLTDVARVAWAEERGVAGSVVGAALLPASAMFRLGAALHHGLYDTGLRRPARAPIPVISIGNLRVGGAGKTPFAGWIVERLLEMGRRPAVLHGGYGSDEPALHRRWHPDVPVFVGRERIDSARAAASAGCDVAVLDDGFQHRRMARDLDIVLLAAEDGVDAVRLLPRGPWREPLTALARAGLVVVTRKTATAERANEVVRYLREVAERRAVHAWIRPDGWSTLDGTPAEAPEGSVCALASIAQPDSFFATVESLGLRLAATLAFPDHHEYSERDVRGIAELTARGAIVTTAKDAVKLGRFATLAERGVVRVLGQRVEIEVGEGELIDRLRSSLEAH